MAQYLKATRNPSLIIVFIIAVFLFFLVPVVGCGSNSGETSSLNQMVQEARLAQDKAKQKAIDIAVTHFTMEYGRSPKSLDELVEKGYISMDVTRDHQGRRFAYTPGNVSEVSWGIPIITKSCGRCGKPVSSSSKVGDRCPHCGVVWRYEKTTYANNG